jgi:hypothetical protein
MDTSLRLAATVALIAVILVVGCVPGLRTAKPPETQGQPLDQGKPGQSPSAGKPTDKPAFDKENLLASVPSPDQLASASRGSMPAVQSSDLVNKEEVSAAALLLAQGVPGTKHVKICYSKSEGTWILLLYVEKGKKLVEQEYRWNKEIKEWDLHAYRKDDLEAKKIDIYLKGELPDEKCFVLR